MKKITQILGVDVGASGGKMGIASFDGNRLDIREYRDFRNRPVHIGSAFYWDVFSIYKKILDGMTAFRQDHGKIDTMAIDAWGATYGLLDKKGRLLEPVYHYRDERTARAMDDLCSVASMKELFEMTGCQCNRTYTLPQLHTYITEDNLHILERASTLLFMPDLISYFLGGDRTCEMTIAGTSGLMENQQVDWNYNLFKKFGFPEHIFPNIIEPGTIRGELGKWVKYRTDMIDTKLIATVEHDSAAAVAAIPGFGKNKLYISIGTNVSMGIERDECLLTEEAFEKGFKNTGGINKKKIVYRDFSASWHINEFMRTRKEQGLNYTHPILVNLAESVSSPNVFIDVEYQDFNNAGGEYSIKMNDFLEKTGQKTLDTDAEFIRCIYESIALKVAHYAQAFRDLGEDFDSVHIVNGATRNELLMQMIANALSMEVEAGMPYATINGNILTQLLATGEVADLDQLRDVSRNSFEMKVYEPQNQDEWKEIVETYQSVMNR